MNTLAPPRGTPASLVTRPVTVVPLWANDVDAVNTHAVMADKTSFLIQLDSPWMVCHGNVRVSADA
jgi:hypothetical protein